MNLQLFFFFFLSEIIVGRASGNLDSGPNSNLLHILDKSFSLLKPQFSNLKNLKEKESDGLELNPSLVATLVDFLTFFIYSLLYASNKGNDI